MSRKPAGIPCGVYVRISDDKSGDALGVARQEADCRKKAAKLGWNVVRVYRENDVTAYRRRRVLLADGKTGLRVVREQFRQLLADLDSGVIGALIAYDLDRIARDMRDLEDLIDVVEERGVPTAAVTGDIDLSNDTGIFMARMMVNVANKSSRDTGRRVSRKHQELAEAGLPGGGGIRSFGYAPNGMDVVPEEAEILKELAARVVAGDSLKAISRDLTERGVPTVKGIRNRNGELRGWDSRSVHSVLSKPRVAGLRSYRGEIICEAKWPAIITRDEWERVCMSLDGRARGNENKLKHWLGGVLVCSLCGCSLMAGQGNAGLRYWCPPVSLRRGGCGKITVNAKVEIVIREYVVAYLSRDDVALKLESATSNVAGDGARASAQEDQEQLRELAAMWAKKEIRTPEYMTARRVIEKRLAGYQEVMRRSLPSSVRTVLTAENVGDAFDNLPPTAKRKVVEFLFPGGIYVLPARMRGRFEPGRIVPAFLIRDQEHLAKVIKDWQAGIAPEWSPLPMTA